jgi:predicted transcriptional regulator
MRAGRVVEPSAAIISIHPDYAEAIVSGSKTIELRRRIPAIPIGSTLWIYATLPMGAIIGTAKVTRIVRASPNAIWKKYGKLAGINRADFQAYFDGADEAIAIGLGDARRCHPVEIAALRKVRHGFHPPQVLTRISLDEATSIEQLSRAA